MKYSSKIHTLWLLVTIAIICFFSLLFFELNIQQDQPTPTSNLSSSPVYDSNVLETNGYTVLYEHGRKREGGKRGNIDVYDRQNKHLWHYHYGDDNLSEPVVKDEILYVFKEPAGALAFELSTGEILWQIHFPDGLIHSDYTVPILTDTNSILVEGYEIVYALDATNGVLLWQWPSKEDYYFSQIKHDSSNVYLYSNKSDSNNHHIDALDLKTGKLIWQRDEHISEKYHQLHVTNSDVCLKNEDNEICFSKKTGN